MKNLAADRQIIVTVTKSNYKDAQRMLFSMGYRWGRENNYNKMAIGRRNKEMEYIRLWVDKKLTYSWDMADSNDCFNRIKFTNKDETKQEIEGMLILFGLSS